MDLNETKIIYIFINLLLLLTFVLGGYNIKRGGSYWKNALSCSFVFILVMGTRYGRGNDYFHYVEVYLNGDNSQYSFLLFNGLLKNIYSRYSNQSYMNLTWLVNLARDHSLRWTM